MIYKVEALSSWSQPGVWLAVIGDPIGHSVSPLMHNKALSLMARTDPEFENWSYVPFEVHPSELEKAVDGFQLAGFKGINLTIPHKVDVLPFIDEIDQAAERVGAVNTIHFDQAKRKGYNTDGYGLEQAVIEAFGSGLKGRDVLVVGAGGASRAAIAQCVNSGAHSVHLTNRTLSKAEVLAARLTEVTASPSIKVLDLESAPENVPPGTLVINATSLGLKQNDALPLDVTRLPEACSLFDMIYNPWETSFLQLGKSRGYPISNGLGMLVHQGARSLEIWTGKKVPAQAMESAALRSLNS